MKETETTSGGYYENHNVLWFEFKMELQEAGKTSLGEEGSLEKRHVLENYTV